jgi:hypothetical protein
MKILKTFLLSLLLIYGGITLSEATITFNPSVAVFVTGGYVNWITSATGTSTVDYGTTTAYGSSVSASSIADARGAVAHYATISGLIANTTYHYKVTTGSDVSVDFTFTTAASPTGTVRTVGTGKTHATIAACVSASAAGDTCLVYAGTTAAAITPRSGSAGAGYFTVQANDALTLTSVSIPSGGSYIAVKGFQISGSVSCSGSSTYVTLNNNYMTHASIQGLVSDPNTDDYWIISNNILHGASGNTMTMAGNYVLIDGNDIYSPFGNDPIYGGLGYSVIRNNKVHDYGPASEDASHHIDCWQWDGSGARTAQYTLFENNTCQRCSDSTGNCHALLSRATIAISNLIIRYNFFQKLQSGGIGTGAVSPDQLPSNRIYNNTIALESTSEATSTWRANYTKVMNNIAYNSASGTSSPFDCDGTGVVCNYNVARTDSTPTATWATNYQNEATYSTLKNLAPGFSNYPYSSALSSSSALIDKGTNLTTVTSGCGTATLTLADVRWFQPGWATTQADTLAIGATVASAIVRQVTGVNYSGTAATSSGTVTFAANVSCTNGDKVWLYARSDGTRILYGTAPDIGAYEYPTASGTVPTAPTTLTVE